MEDLVGPNVLFQVSSKLVEFNKSNTDVGSAKDIQDIAKKWRTKQKVHVAQKQ